MGEDLGQIAKATHVNRTASPMARTSNPGRIPAYSARVRVMTGTTAKQISSSVSGSWALACASPQKARNMITPIEPNKIAGDWLNRLVSKNADQPQMPMTKTSASPTLNGGDVRVPVAWSPP